MFIDSHCHMTHENIRDLGAAADIVKAAKANTVHGMLNICCEIVAEFPHILETVKPLDNVWCTIGTHPHEASLEAEKNVSRETLIDLARSDPKIVGIGESGLDYYYEVSDRKDQAESFRKHIQACMETGLPLVVHSREADRDCMDIIRDEMKNNPKPLTGVLHCFSSSEAMAMEGLEIGFYISFSGMITFGEKLQWLRDIAAKIPLDRVLIETDAPFLAPKPYRGKINQPAYVEHVALALAKMHNLTRAEIGQITSDNFFALFPKARETWVQPQAEAA